MSCFSVRQIEQSESGEGSSFYGDQNKVTAAKKVSELLKLKPEEAFDFGDAVQPAKTADTKVNLQEGAKTFAVENTPNAEKAKVEKQKKKKKLLQQKK